MIQITAQMRVLVAIEPVEQEGHRLAGPTVPGQAPGRSLLRMSVCVSEPAWDFDPYSGLRRAGVLAGAETVVTGEIRVVAKRPRGHADAAGASGAVAVGRGQPGYGSGAGVAQGQLKEPKQKSYVLVFFLACYGYAGKGNVALTRANHRP